MSSREETIAIFAGEKTRDEFSDLRGRDLDPSCDLPFSSERPRPDSAFSAEPDRTGRSLARSETTDTCNSSPPWVSVASPIDPKMKMKIFHLQKWRRRQQQRTAEVVRVLVIQEEEEMSDDDPDEIHHADAVYDQVEPEQDPRQVHCLKPGPEPEIDYHFLVQLRPDVQDRHHCAVH